MKLPLKPTFFSVFLSCLERLVLTYFEIIYLWISWPKSYMKRYEGGIFRKAPDWKRFFFFLILILNKISAAQTKNIMQSSSTFIRISSPIPELKKICIDQWLGNYLILERTWAKQTIGEQVRVVPNTVGGAVGSHNPSKILQCSPSFKLGNSICST